VHTGVGGRGFPGARLRAPKAAERTEMPESHLPLFHVDAFADRPFSGNPAVVCLLDRPREEAWMQSVAREMNLSETAFLEDRRDGFGLRWFTPAVEVDLCGHATLASAHVLFESGRLRAGETARFHTKSGLLSAEWRDGRIELDFPAEPAVESSVPASITEALGVYPVWQGKNRLDYLIEVASEEAVRSACPNLEKLRAASAGARGVIVTSRSETPAFDFVSRYFAPGAGIDEDPVTGSTHCCLGPFWAGRLGRTELSAWQASSRGGALGIRVLGERVHLLGRAVTVVRGGLVAE
jgi:PhzF family phenazine biosynthesis protein